MNTTTTPNAIRKTTGSHLTATDKRNILAVMNHAAFKLGMTYKVNGRKSYAITTAGDRYEVTISFVEVDGWGRRFTRTNLAQFAA